MDNNVLFFLIFGLSNNSNLADFLMIFGAEYLIYLMFLLGFLLLFKGEVKEKKSLILWTLSIPVTVLIIKFVHLFSFEPRPFVVYDFIPLISPLDDASFPSRHASISATVAFAYVYFKSKWATFFLLMAIWVGISRIFVGVHFPLDVLGGILVGIISCLISISVLKQLYKRLFLS